MVKCGIKKFDELPARVGVIDVDFLRGGLHMEFKRLEKAKKKIESITQSLDRAVEENDEKRN